MMFAIFETGGKQYKAAEGDVLYIEKTAVPAGEVITFDNVLCVSDDNGICYGAPYLEGAKITGRVIKLGKAKKINIFKYNAKKNYRNRQGHRQPYTKLEITAISK